jgi:hypothetical protein
VRLSRHRQEVDVEMSNSTGDEENAKEQNGRNESALGFRLRDERNESSHH